MICRQSYGANTRKAKPNRTSRQSSDLKIKEQHTYRERSVSSCLHPCHTDRSAAAKWRDLQSPQFLTPSIFRKVAALPLSSRPKRSEVEGSAVRLSWIIGPTMDKRKVSNVLGEGVFCQRMNPLVHDTPGGRPKRFPESLIQIAFAGASNRTRSFRKGRACCGCRKGSRFCHRGPGSSSSGSVLSAGWSCRSRHRRGSSG